MFHYKMNYAIVLLYYFLFHCQLLLFDARVDGLVILISNPT